MAIYAPPPPKTTERTLAPAGTHFGRCVWVIDIGTQEKEWQGQQKLVRQLILAWELPTEKHTFKEEKGPEPFVVSWVGTFSLGEKSNLRPMLEAWRGRSFTEAELAKFDVAKLLGAPCMITIGHETKGDKTFTNIMAVSATPKGTTVPPQITPSVEYSVTQGRDQVYQSLPEWIRKRIDQCQEFQPRSVPADGPPMSEPEPGQGDDQEIPF